ncbi:Eukaryotic translation initiation factor 2-alpha kinase 3 [Conglomerata obtusa]
MNFELDSILKNYVAEEICGEGGYSRVYKIKNTETNEYFALKEIELENFASCEDISIEAHENIRQYKKLGCDFRPVFLNNVGDFTGSDIVSDSFENTDVDMQFSGSKNSDDGLSSMNLKDLSSCLFENDCNEVLFSDVDLNSIVRHDDEENNVFLVSKNLNKHSLNIVNENSTVNLTHEEIRCDKNSLINLSLQNNLKSNYKLDFNNYEKRIKETNKLENLNPSNTVTEISIDTYKKAFSQILRKRKKINLFLKKNNFSSEYSTENIYKKNSKQTKTKNLYKNTMFYFCRCFYHNNTNYKEAMQRFTRNKKININYFIRASKNNCHFEPTKTIFPKQNLSSSKTKHSIITPLNNITDYKKNNRMNKNLEKKYSIIKHNANYNENIKPNKKIYYYFISSFCAMTLRDFLLARNSIINLEKVNNVFSNVKSSIYCNKIDRLKIAKIFFDIVKGVYFLHKHNLMHRDIKPENIFFGDSYTFIPQIGDFGLIKEQTTDSNTLLSSNVGTEAYQAPEMKGNQYDNKVDVYSLGLVYFELMHPMKTQMERILTFEKIKTTQKVKKIIDNEYLEESIIIENCIKTFSVERFSSKELFQEMSNFVSNLKKTSVV